jgi:hypothetical protein
LTHFFDRHIAETLVAFAEHDAFDLIGALGLINVGFNPERPDEYAGPGLIAAAELGSTISACVARAHTAQSPAKREGALRSPFEAAYSVQDRLIAAVLISGPGDERHATVDTSTTASSATRGQSATTGSIIKSTNFSWASSDRVGSVRAAERRWVSTRTKPSRFGMRSRPVSSASTNRHLRGTKIRHQESGTHLPRGRRTSQMTLDCRSRL